MRKYCPYSAEDYAQECNSYMEIKHFLSNRISEQDKEIQRLKDLVLYHSTKHIEMYEWLKNINNILETIKPNQKNDFDKSLNYSGEFVDSLSISEDGDQLPLLDLKNENLELTKKLEQFNTELTNKNLQITRLSSEKIILLNELSELLICLKRVDLNTLNRFYHENCRRMEDKLELPTALGLKYNILSAQSQVSQMNANNMEFHYRDKGEPGDIQFEKYCSVLKGFTQDFKESIDRNLRRLKILEKRN
jgi:hypothetical protein